MIKIPNRGDCLVSPDVIRIPEMHIVLNHCLNDAVCISFDGDTLHIGNYSIKHPVIHMKLGKNDLEDLRLWYKEKLITMWIRQSKKDVGSILKSVKKAFDSGNIVLYDITNLNEILPNGLDDFSFIYQTTENGENYVVKCNFDELDNVVSVRENEAHRMLHLLTPTAKKHFFETHPKEYDARMEYFKEGERAWVMKHGNIDPAHWHLLMYEE